MEDNGEHKIHEYLMDEALDVVLERLLTVVRMSKPQMPYDQTSKE